MPKARGSQICVLGKILRHLQDDWFCAGKGVLQLDQPDWLHWQKASSSCASDTSIRKHLTVSPESNSQILFYRRALVRHGIAHGKATRGARARRPVFVRARFEPA